VSHRQALGYRARTRDDGRRVGTPGQRTGLAETERGEDQQARPGHDHTRRHQPGTDDGTCLRLVHQA